MKIIESPRRARRSTIKLITCDWIKETSSAETGSSATITSGSSEAPGQSRCAAALAAGKLVRIALRRLGRQADKPKQLGDTLAA